MTEIGDTIYQFDQNHRVYQKNASGREIGSPIYREYFRPSVIVGVEKRSWLVQSPGSNYNRKIAKAAVITAEQMDVDCWVNDHRLKISSILGNCRDAAVLKAVADLVGYAPTEPIT